MKLVKQDGRRIYWHLAVFVVIGCPSSAD